MIELCDILQVKTREQEMMVLQEERHKREELEKKLQEETQLREELVKQQIKMRDKQTQQVKYWGFMIILEKTLIECAVDML